MEDKDLAIPDVNELLGLRGYAPQAYFAVFDGHAGVAAARYAQSHLLLHAISHPSFKSNVREAMAGAIRTTDKAFLRHASKAGTTVLVAFLRGNEL